MEKFQAIFEVLYFLSAADGEVHATEIQVINDYLNANYGKITFDPNAVARSILTLTGQGKVDEFVRAAIAFKNSSSAQDRTTVLDFALRLIAADGKVTKEESDLFLILGKSWDVDMRMYLQSKGIQVK
jgi:tellurite resistance protein